MTTLTPKAKSPRVSNDALLAAGLDLMRQNGHPMNKVESPGRSMVYSLPDGKTVRVRTCNDHILIVVTDKPSGDAKLNIEGTDYLLVVMPEIERTPGKVTGYLIPTTVAVEASRSCHQAWLDSNPNTKGDNKTWCLGFRKSGRTTMSSDYETKWSEYRLEGEAYTDALTSNRGNGGSGGIAGDVADAFGDGSVKGEVEIARQRISKAAGVSPDAVRITIAFG
jgi:hypothetical protein